MKKLKLFGDWDKKKENWDKVPDEIVKEFKGYSDKDWMVGLLTIGFYAFFSFLFFSVVLDVAQDSQYCNVYEEDREENPYEFGEFSIVEPKGLDLEQGVKLIKSDMSYRQLAKWSEEIGGIKEGVYYQCYRNMTKYWEIVKGCPTCLIE